MEWFWAIYALVLAGYLWFGVHLFFDILKGYRARKNRDHKHFWRLHWRGTTDQNMEFRCANKCPQRYFLIMDRELYVEKVMK